jgi:hypothetical protein
MAVALSKMALVVTAKVDSLSSDIEKGVKAGHSRFLTAGRVIGTALAAGIATGIAGIGTAITAGLGAAVKQGIASIDELQASANKLDVGANQLNALRYAAVLTDASIEELTTSITRMQRNIATAAGGGNDKLVSGLKALGFSIEELRRMKPDEQFVALASAIGSIGDRAVELQAGTAIFGKTWSQVINIAEKGGKTIREAAKEIAEMGGLLSPEQLKGIDQLDNNLNRVNKAVEIFKQQLAADVAPGLDAGVVRLVEALKELHAQGKGIPELASLIAAAFEKAVFWIGVWIEGWVKFNAALTMVATRFADFFVRDMATAGKQIAVWMHGLADFVRSFGTAAEEVKTQFVNLTNALGPVVTSMAQTVIKGVEDAVEGTINSLGRTLKAGLPFLPSMPEVKMPRTKVPEFVPFSPENLPDIKGGIDAVADGLDAIGTKTQETTEGFQGLLPPIGAINQEAGKVFNSGWWSTTWEAGLEKTKAGLKDEIPKAAQLGADRVAAINEAFGGRELEREKERAKLRQKALDDYIKAQDELAQNFERTFGRMQDANRALVTDMVSAWITGTGKMSDIISNWANRSLSMMVDVLLFGTGAGRGGGGLFGMGQMSSGMTSMLGGWGGLLGGFGGGGAAAASGLGALGGAFSSVPVFAEGGSFRGGSPIIVGERGPEMLVPKGPGNVIPSNQIGKRGPGGVDAVVVNQTFQVGVSKIELMGILDNLQSQTAAGVLAAVERGGSYRRRIRT